MAVALSVRAGSDGSVRLASQVCQPGPCSAPAIAVAPELRAASSGHQHDQHEPHTLPSVADRSGLGTPEAGRMVMERRVDAAECSRGASRGARGATHAQPPTAVGRTRRAEDGERAGGTATDRGGCQAVGQALSHLAICSGVLALRHSGAHAGIHASPHAQGGGRQPSHTCPLQRGSAHAQLRMTTCSRRLH